MKWKYQRMYSSQKKSRQTSWFLSSFFLFVCNQCGSNTKVWWSIPLIDHVDPVAPISESGLLLNYASGFSAEPSNIPDKHESFIIISFLPAVLPSTLVGNLVGICGKSVLFFQKALDIPQLSDKSPHFPPHTNGREDPGLYT